MSKPFRQKEMPDHEKPISEKFRVAAKEWVDADGAASLLEELKTTRLSQMKMALMAEQGDMPDAKAERICKSDPQWEEYLRDMIACRTAANKLKMEMKALEIEHGEWTSRDANARHESKLLRGTP